MFPELHTGTPKTRAIPFIPGKNATLIPSCLSPQKRTWYSTVLQGLMTKKARERPTVGCDYVDQQAGRKEVIFRQIRKQKP